jgi:preprotein translocase subunit SecY
MISAFANSFKIPELRRRIVFTLMILVVVQIGSHITLPGVDPAVVHKWVDYLKTQGGSGGAPFAQLLNVFSGGGIAKCAIFALGIMPYISASIMMQLLTAVVPRLGKLAKEEGGRMKINQLTRYAAIALCLVQGWMMVSGLLNPARNILLPQLDEFLRSTGFKLVPHPGLPFQLIAVLSMTAGSMLLMWLGDQVTERGIGNGVSIIISANILTSLPGALVQVWKTYITGDEMGAGLKALGLVLLLALLLSVIAGVVAITQAARRVSIQYAKRQMGRKVVGGTSTFLPLKINYAGVMPIIFAQAIILFPAWLASAFFGASKWGATFERIFSGGSVWFYVLDATLIFFFSYFWVATMFQPTQIAEDLKKNGGYIPGVRPGKPTADFLDYTMSRLTFAGAIFLVVIAVLPTLIAHWAGVSSTVSQFFGGTSLLILVGVLLDSMRQVETYLLQKHYDGFLRKGRIRGRFDRPGATGPLAGANMTWLFVVLACIVLAAVVYYFSGPSQ